jgi:hypothetical protein
MRHMVQRSTTVPGQAPHSHFPPLLLFFSGSALCSAPVSPHALVDIHAASICAVGQSGTRSEGRKEGMHWTGMLRSLIHCA